MTDCVDKRERKLLEFVILILYPEKPSQVIVTIANIVFEALSKEKKVSWGIVFQDLISKLVSAVEKDKPSPICPYLFHFYNKNECLRGEEMDMLEATRVMLQFDVAPEEGAQPEPIDLDSEHESLGSKVVEELLKKTPKRRKKNF